MKNKYETFDDVKHISNLWGDDGIGHYTGIDNKCLMHLKEELPEFKGGKIIEVGPGTGQFAKKMFENFKIESYTILDLEKNINDSKILLTNSGFGDKCEFVFSQNYENLFDKNFDLFVSNVCLSETPDYYRDGLLHNVMNNCNNVFIIDGDGLNTNYNTTLINTVKKYFNVENHRDSGYAKCLIISGKK